MSRGARTIVVGYDGSEPAKRALEEAVELAGYGSTVAVVSVARPLEEHTLNRLTDRSEVERSERLVDEAREFLTQRQVTARYVVPIGDPGAKLLQTASELGADLIVVGKRNHNAVQRLLLGSVSGRIVRDASCAVLVVA